MKEPAGHITERERRRLISLVASRMRSAQSYWIFCHENPDGDTLGCSLAAHAGLRAVGKDVRLFTPGPIPRMYSFLPGAEHFCNAETLPEELPDVVMALDTAAFDRIGRRYAQQLTERGIGPKAHTVSQGTFLVNIDHHLGNTMYGDLNLVDPSCCACGELLYYAFKQLELPLTLEVAINLYATIITDTGRFSYANTNYRTFAVASELIQLGVDPFDVVCRVYNKRTPQQITLLSKILGTLVAYPDDGCFMCHVTQSMLSGTESSMDDTEGAVDIMKTIGGYDCCFLLKDEGDGNVKVSARSIEDFDVRRLALRFGGGGHTAAAGFRIAGGLADSALRIRQELQLYRKELAVATL